MLSEYNDKEEIFMKKKLNFLFIFVTIVLTSCLLIACRAKWDGYKGDYPELYTIAISSLPEVKGYEYDSSHGKFQPMLEVIEEDSFGRKLFAYSETFSTTVGTDYLLISQMYDDKYVYFYSELNYMYTQRELFDITNLDKYICFEPKNFSNKACFFIEDIKQLKEQNDWNKEIDENKCIKAEIVRKKIS